MWFNASVDVLADGRRLVVWTDVATAVGAVVSLTIAWEETAAISALLETSIEALPDRFLVARLERGPDASTVAARVEHANAAARTSRWWTEGASGVDTFIGCDIRDVPGLGGDQRWASVCSVAAFGPPSVCRLERVDDDEVVAFAEDVSVSLVGEDHVVISARDVTAAVRAEHVLEQAWDETSRVRAVLQSALDSVRDRFVVLSREFDANGALNFRVETLNAAAAGRGQPGYRRPVPGDARRGVRG